MWHRVAKRHLRSPATWNMARRYHSKPFHWMPTQASPAYGRPATAYCFNLQNVMHSSARTLLKLPATYHSTWSSQFTDSISYTLNITEWSYVNVPCYTRQYITVQDSVVGWGAMRVKLLNGTPQPLHECAAGTPVLRRGRQHLCKRICLQHLLQMPVNLAAQGQRLALPTTKTSTARK